MEKLRVGVIGLGHRGLSLLEALLIYVKDIEISALCDVYEDRVETARKVVEDAGGKKPFTTLNYKEIIDDKKADCVLIITPWKLHVEMSLYCMEKGMPVGIEVCGANTLEECFALVETYERTKTPFMFLENCCYGRRELMILNMVKQGVFGEVIHCDGGYMHDLRDEIAFGKENRHYRLEEYSTRNRENYPTHELGPIAKILDINNGNRFVSLVSMSSKAAGLHEFILQNKADDKELVNRVFPQGDVVSTIIKCARGETINLMLDTTLPRWYSRGFTVRGTKAVYTEDNDSLLFDNNEEHRKQHFCWKNQWGNADEFLEQYEHPIWKKYIEDGVVGGHDGIDYLVYTEFFNCVRDGKPMPLDVYDAAAWMSISPLSEMSIKNGGAPVEVPDFQHLSK